MAKTKTETNVSTIGSTVTSAATITAMSDDEIRALYEKSMMTVEEKGRETATGKEYITSLDKVFSVIGNDREIKFEVLANMIVNAKQRAEIEIANNEGRTPTEIKGSAVSQSLRAFLKNSKLAHQHYNITESRPQMVTKKVSDEPSY